MANCEMFNFVSFNCRNVKRSVGDVRRLCRTAHVIALQEHWLLPHDIDYLSCVDDEFAYTGTSAVDTAAGILRGRPYGGVALLWRKSIFQNVSVVQCDNKRICAIKVDVGQRSFLVMSVYMPTDASRNLTEFTDCLGALSALVSNGDVECVYMLGDFNAHPGEPFYNELTNFCSEMEWTCADIDKLGLTSDTYSYLSDINGCLSWLDHCVVTKSASLTVHNIYFDYDHVCSDHWPLVLSCKLDVIIPKLLYTETNIQNCKIKWGDRNLDQIELYSKLCHEKLRLIDFPSQLSLCCDNYCTEINHRHVIDKLYENIIEALSSAAIKSSIVKVINKRKKRPVVGWNRYVREAHRLARSKFQMWSLSGKPRKGRAWDEMREARKNFKARLRWCLNNAEQIKMDILASQLSKRDFNNFWKSSNKLNHKPGQPASVSGLCDSKHIANMFKDHFTVTSPLGPSQSFNMNGCCGREICTKFNASDIKKAITSMSRGKSPGHDSLSIEHLKYAGVHLPRILAMFYTLCIGHSYLPAEMMRTVVVPIVKSKTGDISDHNNYRPISLATVMAKVLDSLLNSQLDKYLTIHDNQFGFKSGLSTETAILCLKQTVKYYTDRSTPVYAVFLDLSRAFDLVCYDVLWQKLSDISMPVELVQILKYWYLNQVNVVRWAEAFSEPYRLECGVRQGGLTSPKLFNLYINGLIEQLSSTRVGCHIDDVCVNNISYADDMALLSASVCGLTRMLAICEEYARAHGLLYNTKKTEYMVFRAGGGRCPDAIPDIKLNGTAISRVEQFKYLGHIVTSGLKDDVDIERERRALSVRANMIARRFARCSRDVKITLFKAFCTSFYTCSLWVSYTQKQYSAFRVQYNNAFRVVLGLPWRCSASGMFAGWRVDCFYATIRKRCTSLMRRVRASPNGILRTLSNRFDCQYMNHCHMVHVLTNESY